MKNPEYWLRGPVPEIPALLQPVAHALLQVQQELAEALEYFPDESLWEKPSGVASVGFHLQHLAGVIDRLFTYAEGKNLSEKQLEFLANEGKANPNLNIENLLQAFDLQVDKALNQLKSINNDTLTEVRPVGRKQIPSTVIGLIFHTAEHTTRHFGQLSVTVRMLK